MPAIEYAGPFTTRRATLIFLIAILSLQLPALAAHAGSAPSLTASAPCPWGSAACNVCVPDAVGAIAQMRTHGDKLGFQMNGAPDPTLFNHWEGVQRLMSGDGQYLVLSRALGGEGEDVSFVVVEMASRNDKGLRFRSNRLDPQYYLSNTAPPGNDRVVRTMAHEAGFTHAGGMQALGSVLAVPFENDSHSKVVFYDVSQPLAPSRLSNVVDHTSLSHEAGTASLGKLADGRFLLIIGRSYANILDFYVSSGMDLRTTGFEFFDTWYESELTGDDSEFGDYQALNLVAQCDGSLFLVGLHKSLAGSVGRDFVDLFLIENATGNDVAIKKVAKKHLNCDGNCDLDAAGGVYVDPEGRMYLYGTTHDNDGLAVSVPEADSVGCAGPACSTELSEFRPVPHATCGRIEDAWVELYDDSGFGDRSLMIDFVDRDLEDYSNFDHAERFEDKASAVRWCLPESAVLRLWEDKDPCGGSHLDLEGNGALQNRGDLGGFGDETSCVKWLGGPFANAGEDRTVECSGSPTQIQLDGSKSVRLEGSDLTFAWQAVGASFADPYSSTPVGSFPLGKTNVTLTVSNSVGMDNDSVDATVADTIAPTVVCPSLVIVNATTPAGAVVNFSPTAQDSCGLSKVVCVPASGSLFAVGTTMTQCSATDLAGHSTMCSSMVKVKSPAEQVSDLVAAISGLPDVKAGTTNSLTVKLGAALKALAAGRTNVACSNLRAFINEVQAQSSKKITASQAASFITDATRILAALGCS